MRKKIVLIKLLILSIQIIQIVNKNEKINLYISVYINEPLLTTKRENNISFNESKDTLILKKGLGNLNVCLALAKFSKGLQM